MSANEGSYFQCPHCQKRYVASIKARAADGKRIRCKECQEPFTLTIVAAAKPKLPSAKPKRPKAVEKPKPPAPKRVAKPKPKVGKRSRAQWGPLLVLLLALVGSAGWWWMDIQKQLAKAEEKAAIAKLAAEAEAVDEVDDHILPSAEEVRQVTQEVQHPDPSTLNFVVSGACRDVAAAQWLNDYTLTHTRFRQVEFVRLLDKSVSLTAQMKKQCQNHQLLLSVIESAKQGKKPIWLAPLIDTLINPEYDSVKMVNDDGF
ncbi:MAG: hypothetical protein R8J85_01385 [Mariprofundales bacterium]